MNIETELRQEFHRTDDAVHIPPGTVERALRTADRRRRRRRIGAVVSAALAAVAVIVPVSLHQSGPSSGTRAAFFVNNYVVYGSGSPDDLVFDRVTGKYVPAADGKRSTFINPSPDGRNVLFQREGDRPYLVSAEAFASGQISEHFAIPNYGGSGLMAYQWSADGQQILEPYEWTGNRVRFAIYDVASGELGPLVTVPGRQVSWGRSDNEVSTITKVTSTAGEYRSTMRFFSVSGKQQGQLTLMIDGSRYAVGNTGWQFSPTGRYVAFDQDAIYDLRTRRVVPLPKLPRCSAAFDADGWYGDSSYVLGCPSAPALYLISVDGRLLRSMKLPLGTEQMPTTTGNTKVSVTLRKAAGYPVKGGIRF